MTSFMALTFFRVRAVATCGRPPCLARCPRGAQVLSSPIPVPWSSRKGPPPAPCPATQALCRLGQRLPPRFAPIGVTNEVVTDNRSQSQQGVMHCTRRNFLRRCSGTNVDDLRFKRKGKAHLHQPRKSESKPSRNKFHRRVRNVAVERSQFHLVTIREPGQVMVSDGVAIFCAQSGCG